MIKIQNVSYQIKNRSIIRDFDLLIDKGQFVSIIGANGAGKSTLLRLIAGELNASAGCILIKDKAVSSYSIKELAKFRAYLHQTNMLEIPFTVRQVVAMGRYHSGSTGPDEESIINECLRVCSLDNLCDRSIRELSGGEQQRVHLARVLAQLWDAENGLLLLDEPISNMDIQYQHQTLAIAKAFTKIGFLVVAVLHDLNLIAQYSDNVVMMKAGRAWWYGSPIEVFNQQNIYSIFGIDTTIDVNPRNLITQVQVTPTELSVNDFNSFYVVKA
ncbi:MAG: heme ABC transporter ATP-binding protein [Sphingobacterium sp.]